MHRAIDTCTTEHRPFSCTSLASCRVCINILSMGRDLWLLTPHPHRLCLTPPEKLLFLKWHKSHNWACFERTCQCMGHWWSGWILLNATPPTVPLPPPTTMAPHSPHIPSRVARITSFSPNGHFGWQVHYTLYFQIVYPLLMPGRLIALAASPGKGLTSTAGTSWKTVITVFL